MVKHYILSYKKKTGSYKEGYRFNRNDNLNCSECTWTFIIVNLRFSSFTMPKKHFFKMINVTQCEAQKRFYGSTFIHINIEHRRGGNDEKEKRRKRIKKLPTMIFTLNNIYDVPLFCTSRQKKNHISAFYVPFRTYNLYCCLGFLPSLTHSLSAWQDVLKIPFYCYDNIPFIFLK